VQGAVRLRRGLRGAVRADDDEVDMREERLKHNITAM
jgi:hypothetical protein